MDPARMCPRLTERPDDQLSLMAEIGVDAAQKALAAAGRTGAQVDGVLCAASNMQRAYPAMAVEIQQALGAGGYGFDMNVACSSATFAIEQAVNAARTGSARCVLVVSPEITSGHHAWRDRDCHFIFGDVCTAVIVERANAATSPDQWEVLGTRLVTQFSNNIRNNFGFLNRAEDSDPDARDKTFRQEGRKVFKEVVPMAAAHIESHLAALVAMTRSRATPPVTYTRPTRAPMTWIEAKMLGAQPDGDVAPLILDEFANTASAGSIIAFHRHRAGPRPATWA